MVEFDITHITGDHLTSELAFSRQLISFLFVCFPDGFSK